MKRIFLLPLAIVTLSCTITMIPLNANAVNNTPVSEIELLGNGYYYETIIEDSDSINMGMPYVTTHYITKTKTTQMKDSSDNILWSVSVKATFSYDGTTSKCTSCTPSASSFASTWSIKSVTSSKSGNPATATAIATHTAPSGATQDIKKSVTIQCSPDGIVS